VHRLPGSRAPGCFAHREQKNEGPTKDADPLIGCLIDDRYFVTGRLGVGAMGLVYDAVHVVLEQSVALKVLRPELAAERQATKRFFREARAAGTLAGPHVAAVHDVGQLSDGRPYLVMERLSGKTVGEVIQKEAPMNPARVAALLRGPAMVLTEAHARGIVHRDVKPENLILARDYGGDERVVVVDFGLAAFFEPGPMLERLTRAGVVLGTPEYMAPECTGDDPLTSACDVYGLATVAFEMLTGFPPFQMTNPIDLLRAKAAQDAPSLAAVSGIPFSEAFEAVLACGLARAPAARFETPAAFANALGEALRMAR
jgi:serine/threonine-protein kinase